MLGARLRLKSDPTYFYFGPGGINDDAHGLTPQKPFADPAFATAWIGANVDCSGCALILEQTAQMTWGETVLLTDPIGIKPGGWPVKPLVLRGDPTGVHPTIINTPTGGPPGAAGLFPGYGFVALDGSSTWWVEGFELEAAIVDACADFGSRLYWGKNWHTGPSSLKIIAEWGGKIELVDDCYISSNGNSAVQAAMQAIVVQAIGKVHLVKNAQGNYPTFSSGVVVGDPSSAPINIAVVNDP